MTSISLTELARQLDASLYFPEGSSDDATLTGIAPVDRASAHDVTFLISPEYMKFAATTQAAAVIVGKAIPDCPRPQLVHPMPYWAFAMTFQMFVMPRFESCHIDPRAAVSSSAKIGQRVTVYPNVHISEDCVIGDRVVVFPGVFLGRGVHVGADTILRANVVVEDGCQIGERVLIHANTTIGADGFGFAPGHQNIAKIPQVGIVKICDDVEIGAGTTIDRAAMGETVIGRGCKLDSSVHVAHNVRMGDHTMMCGGAFIAGSAKIGNWCILAGSSSINNHVEICDRVTVGALAGVTKSIQEPGEYMGFPAIPAREWRREIAYIRRLKSMDEKIANIQEQLGHLNK